MSREDWPSCTPNQALMEEMYDKGKFERPKPTPYVPEPSFNFDANVVYRTKRGQSSVRVSVSGRDELDAMNHAAKRILVGHRARKLVQVTIMDGAEETAS